MQLTELHRHIDCSIRPETLADLGLFPDADSVKREFWVTKPMASLSDVLSRFPIFQRALATREICERVGFEVVEDAFVVENISTLELRYSPRFASEISGLPWQDVLESFQKGITRAQKKYPIRVGLICILSRGHSTSLAEETIDFAIANRKHFMAIDLAGTEIGFPCRLYTKAFQKARNAGLQVTVHAGEACGPENIWEAIDLLGATRIGHGCAAIKDKELMKRMAKDQILIETCPTSNYVTQAVPSLKEHPLPKFLKAGIPCSVSTDDPGFFGVTMQSEFEICCKEMGLSENEVTCCNQFAESHTFL